MGITDSIGNTPLVELNNLNGNPRVRLMAKLEGSNPRGSVKDRIAYYVKVKLTMPECVSVERRRTIEAFGAEIELTPGYQATDGVILRAHQILKENPERYYMPNQFDNESNVIAHRFP
ncbi:MAG: Cysteine synthase [Dehalococcoidia bacterium]|nr:Cysteine synthase [Chloroflexota bacterium]MBT9160976.1 Cysteine synthase [Chloroflexota bacterium]MBT9162889.1 Cysteine synthase [Chloroflexota bacterium]